jgi:hypothetical protein
MKVLFIKASEVPKVIEVKNDLKPLQDLVGGYIECVRISSNVSLVCNEEGKLKDLSYNLVLLGSGGENIVDAIFGDCFLIGNDKESGEFTDISESDIKKYTNMVKEYGGIILRN